MRLRLDPATGKPRKDALKPQARRSHQREEDSDAGGSGGQPKAASGLGLQRVPSVTVAKEGQTPLWAGKGLLCPGTLGSACSSYEKERT